MPLIDKQKIHFLLVMGLLSITLTSVLAQNSVLTGSPLSLQQVAQYTINNSPDVIKGQWNVKMAQAGAQIAGGGFNFIVSGSGNFLNNRPIPSNDDDTQDVSLTLSKHFRTGIDTSITTGISRIDERVDSGNTTNVSTLNFNLTIPLLKGRGRTSSGADEKAAILKSQAAELTYYHGVTQLLLASTNAYWDYKAAIENLKVHESAEKRLERWVNMAMQGIKRQTSNVNAYLTSHKSEVSKIKAYAADKRKNKLDAIAQLATAKGTLAVIMGLSGEQVTHIGKPADSFAVDWQLTLASLKQNPKLAQWVALAMKSRLDIQAADLTQQASKVTLAKARQDILPLLNFSFNATRNAAELGNGFDRYFDSLNSNLKGTNLVSGLSFGYPIGNDLAKGLSRLKNAEHQLNLITTTDLKRTVGVQIGIANALLLARMQEAVASYHSVNLYLVSLQKLYNQSNNSLLNDPNKLLNLIDADEKLTDAGINLTETLLNLSKAISQLRFETGTMLTATGMNADELKLGLLSQLPE